MTAIALLFQYVQGFNDSGSIVATLVYSGALDPGRALVLVAVFSAIGAIFLPTAVALTFVRGIVDPQHLNLFVIWSALISALIWNVAAGIRGIPTSSTHALIGGILGATLVSAGPGALHWTFIGIILLALLLSPFAGLLFGYLLTRGALWLFGAQSPSVARRLFERFQLASSSAIALAYGANDAQKTVGVLTLGLLVTYRLEHPQVISSVFGGGVPVWVRIACAAAVFLGIVTGGYRTMKTLGSKIYRIRSVHGFSAQTASAAVVYASAVFGFPMSTTQVISSSVVGAGAAQRISAVKWNVVGRIMSTWIITFPCTAVAGGIIYVVMRKIYELL